METKIRTVEDLVLVKENYLGIRIEENIPELLEFVKERINIEGAVNLANLGNNLARLNEDHDREVRKYVYDISTNYGITYGLKVILLKEALEKTYHEFDSIKGKLGSAGMSRIAYKNQTGLSKFIRQHSKKEIVKTTYIDIADMFD